MTRLFLKIFLWFWATAILTGLTLVGVVMFQNRQIRPQDHEGLIDTVRYFGTAAANITEQQGSQSGTEYLRKLSQDVRMRSCLFESTGKPIAGDLCDFFEGVINGVVRGQTSEYSMPNNMMRMGLRVKGQTGLSYIFATELPVGPRAMLQTNVSALIIRGGLAFLMSAVVCYVLAQFLTGPILNLRTAAQRITAGDLGGARRLTANKAKR
jgi:hypothetical protein